MRQKHRTNRAANAILAATIAFWALSVCPLPRVEAQPYGRADAGEPGDAMIQAYLAQEAAKIDGRFLEGIKTADDWKARQGRLRGQYMHMLGLYPVPPKTDLKTTVVGTVQGEGYVVDRLHYQSRPGLYVTANLYRPATIAAGAKLPAVLYVCGHSNRGADGNKTAYQSHGIWFAKHGYICLTVDTLQLGEIAAIHHGTYREDRFWWHSRGYTPAGVECWNGVRGVDLLVSRPDVDPQLIAVTGISGGGAATFWIAAADERVSVAVPVSGMADLESYVSNRVINGHCDCMFLYNTFQWPWTNIAALIAPRPMLFINSDNDAIFPMDANQRVINRLERFYSLFGASDRVDAVVSIGGHAYREDIRQAEYRFLNTWLKGDAKYVEDSENDLVTDESRNIKHPIPPERLRVFADANAIPPDQINTKVDESFVPMADVAPPAAGQFPQWKTSLLSRLRKASFGSLPDRIPAAQRVEGDAESAVIETEAPIRVTVRRVRDAQPPESAKRIVLAVLSERPCDLEKLVGTFAKPDDQVYVVETRGAGATRWTRKNPPNYVERSHVLLGRTVDTGRIRDIVAAALYLKSGGEGKLPIQIIGEADAGVLAAYAALLEDGIESVGMLNPPSTHMDPKAPTILNVLREADIADVAGMLAPRLVAITGAEAKFVAKVKLIHERAEAPAP